MLKNQYHHLLRPGSIGSMQLRNRIVVAAMGANFGEADGSSDERVVAYHEAQARGGAGLVISGACGVMYPIGKVQPFQIAISDDRYADGVARVAAAVQKHGARFAVQLHQGGLVATDDPREGRPLWCPSLPQPSDLREFIDGFLLEELASFAGAARPEFKVLSHDDIASVVAHYAAAALRAREAGADGVEIHGGHGYLLSSFLSPRSNRRDDEYGGSVENRSRFLVEVIEAVRAAVGKDFPVWVKLDTREVGKEDGIKLEHALVTAKLAEAAGADAIFASAYHDGSKGKLHSASNIPHELNTNLPAAAAIRKAVSIPVIGAGRIEPEYADQAIGNELLDFIAMGRKLLADPDLPNKLAAGRDADVRPCVYCYTCVSAIYTRERMRCAVNPELGFEYTRQDRSIGKPGQHIAVIGGGPGGMEAARRLRLDGHRVTLIEQSNRLGGTLQFASIAYEPNERLLNWLMAEMAKLQVDVRLNTKADPALLKQLGVDAVIVATGARRDMPEIPGNDGDHVFSGDDMRRLMLGESSAELRRKTNLFTRAAVSLGSLTGATANLGLVREATNWWMPLGDHIVIIGGELVGLELAEFLAHRGRKVTVIDEQPRMGAGLMLVRRLRLLAELREAGVQMYRQVSDIRINKRSVSFTTDADEAVEAAAYHVIVARGATGDNSLAEHLRSAGFMVETVGDCNGVSYIEGALRSAMGAVDRISVTDISDAANTQ